MHDTASIAPHRPTHLNIVFLHGFLGDPSDWDPLISHLPKYYRPLCPSLPGHGNTPCSSTFDFLAPAEPFHLVGYSMGGRLALQYAKKYPRKILSLIVASTHPGLRSKKERMERLKIDAAWAERLQTSSMSDFLKIWYNQPIFGGFQPDLTKRMEHNPQKLAQTLMDYSLAKQSRVEISKAIHLVGEKDEKFVALHPEAHIIPSAGHMVHLENPKAFASLLKQLLIHLLFF